MNILSNNETTKTGISLLISFALLLAVVGCKGDKGQAVVEEGEAVEADIEATDALDETGSTTSTETMDEATDAATTMGYTLADNGDILNASGSVAHTALSYDVDVDGNLIGIGGRMIANVTELTEDFRTKLASMLPTLRLNRMKVMFTDMIVKKEGAEKTYALSNIEFEKESHKISNFSKAEVEGLAAALKENKTGNIEVHVYAADGKNAKDNSKRSDMRAQVVRDMLVTLGVGKDQIKAVGKGDSDAAMAKLGKVDIVVN